MKDVRPLTRQDMFVEGAVSIWLGHFTRETQMEEYFHSSRFADDSDGLFFKDYGLSIWALEPGLWQSTDLPYNDDRDAVDVRTLFEVFSWSPQWIEAAIEAATEKGWRTASYAFLIYGFRYDPALATSRSEVPLSFIGSFDYNPQDDEASVFSKRRKELAKPLPLVVDQNLQQICQLIRTVGLAPNMGFLPREWEKHLTPERGRYYDVDFVEEEARFNFYFFEESVGREHWFSLTREEVQKVLDGELTDLVAQECTA